MGATEQLDPAVVLPTGHPRAVAIIRSLGRAGIPVCAADAQPSASGMLSRFAGERYHLPDDEARTLDWLEAFGRERGGVLFPTRDELLVAVSKQHERFAKSFAMTVPPWEVLGPLMDRKQFYATCDGLGLRTPPRHAPRDEAELRALAPTLDFRRHAWLFKTEVWEAPADPVSGRHTRVCESPEDLVTRWSDVASRTETPPLIERVVPATSDRCVGVSLVIDRHGTAGVAYAVRRLRLETYAGGPGFEHPYELGANVFCETVHDVEAMDAALRLAAQSGYRGCITFEFRRDASDDALTVMKADPRPVRATALSARIGMDVPRAQYAEARGEALAPAGDYADGVGWLWTDRYLRALRSLEAGSEARRELVRLARRIPRIRAFAHGSLRDPWPFLRNLLKSLPRERRRPAVQRLVQLVQRRRPLIDATGGGN